MRVLVIHDRESVISELSDVLNNCGVAEDAITVAKDGVRARRSLGEEIFDLAIFDLTISHIEGRTQTDFSIAEELLIELFESDTLQPPGDIIGLTRDRTALSAIDNEIGPHLMSVIEEDTGGEWKKLLSDRIRYISNMVQARQKARNKNYDYDVVIICALDKEYTPYRNIFSLSDDESFPKCCSFYFRDKGNSTRKGICFPIGRPGQASSASYTQALLNEFRPQLVIMSGFCGGFSTEVNLGDLIIAEVVFDWDSGKWERKDEEENFVPRPEPVSIRGTDIHGIVRDYKDDKIEDHDALMKEVYKLSSGRIDSFEVHLGPLASGSAVVANKSVISRIQGLNEKMLGVDMEAYGFYWATDTTQVKKPNFVVLKAAADYCDEEKNDKEHAACCFLSAKYAEDIIRNRWDFDESC